MSSEYKNPDKLILNWVLSHLLSHQVGHAQIIWMNHTEEA